MSHQLQKKSRKSILTRLLAPQLVDRGVLQKSTENGRHDFSSDRRVGGYLAAKILSASRMSRRKMKPKDEAVLNATIVDAEFGFSAIKNHGRAWRQNSQRSFANADRLGLDEPQTILHQSSDGWSLASKGKEAC